MNLQIVKLLFITILFFVSASSFGQNNKIRSNAIQMDNAPKWLKRTRVDKIIDSIQMHMEWTIRRVTGHWYYDQKAFQSSHKLGPAAVAYARRNNHSIHLGPKVNSENFDQIFAHELVHVISFQKYKDAIPRWLEEGLASYLSKKEPVNYKWLAKQAFPEDVRKMTHPYTGSIDQTKYHYKASQALAEMLAKKCDLTNLLRLSVERKMETYIQTYCEIKDLNASFRDWVLKKANLKKKS